MPENKAPVVTVDGHSIPVEAIEFELGRLVRFYSAHLPEEQVRTQLPLLRRRAVDQAVGARLLMDEAARLDLPVPDAEVEERLAVLTRQAGGPEKLTAMLKQRQLSPVEFREQIRRGRRVDKLVERLTGDAPEPTEADIAAHFAAHRDEYSKAERVRAQHILVKPADGQPASQQAARAKIEEIRARVAAGGDFAAEAAAHSECPSGKQAGGSLGWVSRGMMVPAFDAALFALETGALSEIVETEFGFHLICKNDAEAATEADLDEVRDQVRDFLRHARRGELLAAHVAELWAKAAVTVDGQPRAANAS